MKRVAILGGSFNPVHNGHLGIARCVVEQGLAEEIWLMVSPRNPLKEDAGLLDENIRFEMVRRAVERMPGVVACDFEFHLPRPSYTWKTLEAVAQAYPDYSFSLVIGSDNWCLFPRWAHYQEILRRYSLVVYPREGFPVDVSELPHGVRLLDAPTFSWSSTIVRHRLEQGEDISDMVPPAVMGCLETLYPTRSRS